MGRAHSSEKGWPLGSQGAGLAAPNCKRSVGRPPTRWTDDIERVAVPLCFGLTSGFIVPSGIQEIITDIEDGLNSIHKSASKTRNMLLTPKLLVSTSVKPSSTEKAVSKDLDKDIYVHSQIKESDVKSRAYIYIKQNTNKPIQNRVQENPIKTPFVNNSHKSYLLNLNKVFEDFPRQFSIGYISENLHKDKEFNKNDHRCHGMKVQKDQIKSEAYARAQTYKPFSNEQRKFIERLKNPSIRSEVKPDNKINNLKYLGIDNKKVETSNVFYASASDKKDNDSRDWIGKKSYQNSLHGDRYLLDELIKQKLGEKGSLFVCHDCDKANKTKSSYRLHFEVMCKCGSNLL
ncbi:jg1086 [Pararge aegeria aegeria]|uniref:Jg1086 protein n=1 Tax=Pararge aegeria aegeria TaxID=348720 RepID=A0A8S4QZ79_9NEOP|nr:jg1086 [Pararge aegeria aegeria]